MKYIVEITPSQIYQSNKDAISRLLVKEGYNILRFGIPNIGEYYIHECPLMIVKRISPDWNRYYPQFIVTKDLEKYSWWE